jgi:hypothetical protein
MRRSPFNVAFPTQGGSQTTDQAIPEPDLQCRVVPAALKTSGTVSPIRSSVGAAATTRWVGWTPAIGIEPQTHILRHEP